MGNFLTKLFGLKPNYKDLLANGALIIDVRSKEEFRSGHIEGSLNYPLNSLESKIAELKAHQKPIIAVCHSGVRSTAAVGQLKRAGIEAFNGGGWKSLQEHLR